MSLIEEASLRQEISAVLNKYSKENGSNTPDFVLADYLMNCLTAFDKAIKDRDQWYGRGEGQG